MSDLDRGALAKIDRKVLSGLGHEEVYQMVRVPVSEALWSTWRRYCEALGVSMGRAVSGLIAHELRAVASVTVESEGRFTAELDGHLLKRAEALDARELRLEEWEQRLEAAERRLRAMVRPIDTAARGVRVGRNERCPCGSGVKYKHCHGGPHRSEP